MSDQNAHTVGAAVEDRKVEDRKVEDRKVEDRKVEDSGPELDGQRRRVVPPVWFAALLSVVGIVGMRLVYGAITTGSITQGLVGAVLLVIAVVLVGTPLALAQYLRREAKGRRG